MKTFWVVIISVILTAGVVGGGIWYFLDQQATRDKTSLNTQISDLQAQITKLKATTTTTTTPTTTDATASWKTYTSSTYGFSVKYPDGWKFSDTGTSIGASVDVSTANGQSYYSIDFSRDKFATINEYISSQNTTRAKTIAEGGPGAALPAGETVTINGIAGTKLSDVGNGTAGSRDWYLLSNNGYVYKIALEKTASEGPVFNLAPYIASANQILSTFQFTK